MRRAGMPCMALLAVSVVAHAQRGGPVTVAPTQAIPEAVKGALERSEEQLHGAATAGMTATEIDQLQSIAVLYAEGQSGEAAGTWDALLLSLRERGVRASFSTEPDAYMDPATGNIMGMLFYVFRQSIVQQNEDKRYFLERLEEHNKLGEALRVYLGELSAALIAINAPDDEKEPEALRRPLTAEIKAEGTVVSYEQVRFTTPRQIAAEKKRATTRLRASEQKADGAREEIYTQLRADPERLRDYQSLQNLLLERAREVYQPDPPSPRIPPPH